MFGDLHVRRWTDWAISKSASAAATEEKAARVSRPVTAAV
jgi:hypothetical protein